MLKQKASQQNKCSVLMIDELQKRLKCGMWTEMLKRQDESLIVIGAGRNKGDKSPAFLKKYQPSTIMF